jgi:hypothetical protein
MGTQYSHLHDKLLFGTDWYMTLVALGGKSYRKFCDDAWLAFSQMPNGDNLWIKCTFLNPLDFYGFYETDAGTNSTKLDNIVNALDAANCKKDVLKQNLAHFKRLQKEYKKFVEERKKAKGE